VQIRGFLRGAGIYGGYKKHRRGRRACDTLWKIKSLRSQAAAATSAALFAASWTPKARLASFSTSMKQEQPYGAPS
jgi:hypothetical protein